MAAKPRAREYSAGHFPNRGRTCGPRRARRRKRRSRSRRRRSGIRGDRCRTAPISIHKAAAKMVTTKATATAGSERRTNATAIAMKSRTRTQSQTADDVSFFATHRQMSTSGSSGEITLPRRALSRSVARGLRPECETGVQNEQRRRSRPGPTRAARRSGKSPSRLARKTKTTKPPAGASSVDFAIAGEPEPAGRLRRGRRR